MRFLMVFFPPPSLSPSHAFPLPRCSGCGGSHARVASHAAASGEDSRGARSPFCVTAQGRSLSSWPDGSKRFACAGVCACLLNCFLSSQGVLFRPVRPYFSSLGLSAFLWPPSTASFFFLRMCFSFS